MYVIARGLYLNRWVEDLSHKYLPYEYLPGVKGHIQLAVRPVQLFEIAFPEPQLQKVLNIVNPTIDDYSGKYKWLYNIIKSIAKMLGLKKLPKGMKPIVDADTVKDWMMGVHLVGIKKDEYKNDLEQL